MNDKKIEFKLKKEIETLKGEIENISGKLNTAIAKLVVPAVMMGNKNITDAHQEVVVSGAMVDSLFDKLDFMELIIEGKDDDK